MQAEPKTREPGLRELKRLRQIAKEEADAARNGDAETPCRLTELLPQAVADCQSAAKNEGSEFAARNALLLEEIRVAHEQAERCLEKQMKAVRVMLLQCTTARQTLRAYDKNASLPRLDNQG